ncbi:MAG: A24 family peptidase [Desulfobacterales bacterium]|nr:A24 family peptidase [Desulfobacterales bacterium]
MMNHLMGTFAFLFGMCTGSFLNVCIYRLPDSKSIVSPRSMCPGCGQTIRFYDNIPIISYLWLRGRCRACHMAIAFRYVIVEAFGGFLSLCVFLQYGATVEGLVYFAFIAALIVITYIDIDHQIIPDVITLPGIFIGFIASFFLPAITYKGSIIGILSGGGSLFAIAWIYHLMTRKEGMGGGDIKLLAMIGAFLGLEGVIYVVFFGSAIGTLVGSLVMLQKKQGLKLAVPFGPFLSIGAISYIFFGPKLISWYLHVLN